MPEEKLPEIRLPIDALDKIEEAEAEKKKGERSDTLPPEVVEALMGRKEEAKLEDVFGTEEATAKCLIELIKPDRINLLTDLSFEEIQALVVAETFGQYIFENTGSDLLLRICHLYKELKVSLGRRGRREIIDLATFVGIAEEEKKGRLPKLLPSIR